jgi:hypothetical protein
VIDPDLDLNAGPIDRLVGLQLRLERDPDRIKTGLGLEIGDRPDGYPWHDDVIRHESVFWSQPLHDQFFAASVDSPYALSRASHDCLGEDRRYDPALRTNSPDVACHLPGCLSPFDLDDEERYDFDHSTASGSKALRIRESAGP